MSLYVSVLMIAGAIGALASVACLVVLVRLLPQHEWRRPLNYPSVKRYRALLTALFAIICGTILGSGANCCCYQVVVPGLYGYIEADADRAMMYWLYCHVFPALGVCLDQSEWDAIMALIRILPVMIELAFFTVGFVLVQRVLGPRFQVRPSAWYPRCPYCLYNLRGNVSGVCPECGMPISKGDEE